tara:strand:- start:2737 stop:3354 length:618 start_codon:yes stop_codon:yes gene_type:complete
MNKEKYIEDIKDIKDMMNRSSRFISLSGMSGICAGVFSLIGAYLAYETIYSDQEYFEYRWTNLTNESLIILLAIALGVILFSLITGIYFTTRKAQKINQKLWDQHTKKYLINLSIPLISGGILSLILLLEGYGGLIAPLTLIFYGLALVNGSHFTLKETRSLGIMEILLGLLATYFVGYGLIFWAIGFGLLHIIYGAFMYFNNKI